MIQATLHQLRVFETVARHGSFTKAAEELFITQPTVSSQVKHLTKAVGLPLFEQIGKQVHLTDAGKELLDTCRDIFDRLDNFEMKIADFKGAKQGKLRLAMVTTAKYFMPRLLGSFCQEYQAIDISLEVTNNHNLVRRMLENQDDLYILSQLPEDLDLNARRFMGNPLVVVARQDHPLAGESNIPIKRLKEESFIMREHGSGTRQTLQKLLAKHKVSVKVRLELGSNEAIKQAIAGGLGISVLSELALLSNDLKGELIVLDVEHFPLQNHWYIASLAGKQLSVIAKTFLEDVIENSQKKDKQELAINN